ncbi:MAG TPA: S1/P1 nuclease [Pyrinomonadaceae bacterium]|nr:S1/P1 nuclease [Pyrinomonadaceae bacterium]
MKRKLFIVLTLALAMLLPQTAFAWNGTGHQIVAGIAWDNMTPTARRNAITLLLAAPPDACLLDRLPPSDNRPQAERDREFFMIAATWPDIVRPSEEDTRPCTRFHRRNWHFINYFWEGVSGGTGSSAPEDREDIAVPEVNAVERLKLFRPLVACGTSACGTTPQLRATSLAWILHLVGDIHQPLHTSARVTTRPLEREGDQGGNLFKLGPGNDSLSLHSYWDGIINRVEPRLASEQNNDLAYFDRMIRAIVQQHPRNQAMINRLRPGDFDEWSLEGLDKTKRLVYPSSLQRGQMPNDTYRLMAFRTSREAMALAGYRLADLLNQMLG